MFAREVWQRIETINAVTYFAPESAAAAKDAGLRGFWMGYFGFRAAPMGAVSAGVVEATFANFEPAMVQRSIPDAWSFANPNDLVSARASAAAAALRRVAVDIDRVAADVNNMLESVIAVANGVGRTLFVANRRVDRFDDPVEQLWQNCTTLREHRGDGHIAALVAAGLDGCEAHHLMVAGSGIPGEVLFDNRGWGVEAQAAAEDRLVERGLLDDGLTATGHELRASIETTTDHLASRPFDTALDPTQRNDLLRHLSAGVADVLASDTIPFPNPMGLPELSVAELDRGRQ